MHLDRILPPLPTLRAFCAIAHTGGFGRAAEQLHLTQTAVSHQMAQLEDWLGARLFDRGRHGARLTPLGDRLLPQVERALDLLDDALWSARTEADAQSLTLSVTPEFFSQWLSARLPDFCALYPAIEVKLVVGYRVPDFGADGVDLAIWLGTSHRDVVSEPFWHDEEFAVSSPDLAARLPKREALRAAPLLQYQGARHTALDWQRWYEQSIVLPDNADRAAFDKEMEAAIASGPIYNSFAEMLEACRRGEGFALVRSSLVQDDLRAGTLVRCFIESMPAAVNYALTYRPGIMGSAAAKCFRDWLMASARTP
ncbi:LysR substrate-binding domain-containing protein [Paradevosia shaoguanensis]|uniref:LysR substrate-binding domain-containing protein n=1 Tax=Paradevosia shaoguanensis TaxID=1335043 RepID=UPI0019314187|nr:LysR substrate-binding domain-containing protein [Paradevosia shaoguanensis]